MHARSRGIGWPSGRAAMRAVAVAAVVCAALAGCSSGDPEDTFSYTVSVPNAGDAGSLPDSCSLLTPAEIGAASGIDFADGYLNDDLSTDTRSVCEWLPTDATNPLAQVIVSGGADQISTERSAAEAMFGTAVDVAVPGAQDAYVVAEGSILGMVVGDYFVQVGYMSTATNDVLDITLALAAKTAASLS